ncbi:MAG TPA: hypothetical protein PKH77_27635 [Anaerolineae bacterium]|nr:hypothetical protein [Anaerolineae bacterium]
MKGQQIRWMLAVSLAGVLLILGGCSLTPQMTYQGRLTDVGGSPLNGAHRMQFRYYHDDNTGTAVYTQTKIVQVTEGLFDVVIGPDAAGSGLSAEELSQPLWVEVEVANGVYTETLSPRQKLYGAPYAFTLMQGAVISGSLDSTLYGAQGVEAVLTVGNGFETSGSNQSLPALRVEGEKGLELSGFPGAMAGSGIAGTIYSDLSDPGSDLIMNSRDSVYLYLDAISDDSTAIFGVTAGNGQYICNMNEDGDLDCRGTITGATLRTAAEVDGDTRALYGVQSPQAWLEDFGTAQLRDGTAFVKLEALFAKAIQADSGYHVFLTPLGETQGLYVAKKTPTGFEVREQGGGTADIAFDYRIVAQPAGDTGARMPLVGSSTQTP